MRSNHSAAQPFRDAFERLPCKILLQSSSTIDGRARRGYGLDRCLWFIALIATYFKVGSKPDKERLFDASRPRISEEADNCKAHSHRRGARRCRGFNELHEVIWQISIRSLGKKCSVNSRVSKTGFGNTAHNRVWTKGRRNMHDSTVFETRIGSGPRAQ